MRIILQTIKTSRVAVELRIAVAISWGGSIGDCSRRAPGHHMAEGMAMHNDSRSRAHVNIRRLPLNCDWWCYDPRSLHPWSESPLAEGFQGTHHPMKSPLP